MRGFDFLNSLGDEWSSVGEMGLGRITSLMAALGDVQDLFRVVHVAGTNGKGSVSAALSSILNLAGKKVGTYTSPHLESVTERVMIDGRPISEDKLNRALEEVMDASSRANIKPSFFEAMTAAAFVVFRKESVTFVVLEVGLGGRLDATNVIKHPDASVVTSIDYDHQHILGETLHEIALEKAGIVKERTPVFVGNMLSEPYLAIAGVAKEKNSTVVSFNTGISVEVKEDNLIKINIYAETVEVKLGLRGTYQANNMALAYVVARYLGISVDVCKRGLERVFWPARVEHLEYQRPKEEDKLEFIIDGAHNIAGVRELISYLKSRYAEQKQSLVFGVLSTKDWKVMLDMLVEHFSDWHILKPNSSRALELTVLEDYLRSKGVKNVTKYNNPNELVTQAEFENSKVICCGSLYMVGELRRQLNARGIVLWN